MKRSLHLLRRCGTAQGRRALAVVIGVMVICAGLTGCVSQMRAESSRPVKCKPVEAFVASDGAFYARAMLGIFPAQEAAHAEGTSQEVTSIYAEELLQRRIFSKLKMIPRKVTSDEEALWWGRHENCDLVMAPAIRYLLTGSGTMPTKLEMHIRILDTRTGRVLWDLKQTAFSEPGMDIDLYWHTVSGRPAQGHLALAKALAEQLSEYLAPRRRK